MINFEVGKTYGCRSVCDYDCVWLFTVLKRTDKTITVMEDGEVNPRSLRINSVASNYRGAESVYPLGKYSMCPILSADKIVKEN